MMNQHTHPAQPAKNAVLRVRPTRDEAPAGRTLVRQEPLWRAIRDDALGAVDRDPALEPMFDALVLQHSSLRQALVHVLAYRLGDALLGADQLTSTMMDCLADEPAVLAHVEVDMQAVYERDPACERAIEPLLYFKGFHALQAHRFANHLWNSGRQDLALVLQSRMSAVFQLDIHPATQLGAGIFFDHGTGIVIGKTAVIYDNVSIMQNVTLGGTGKERGDRHPKVHCGVLVGAGAKVLGNIVLGEGARVAASSVVLDPVPPRATVAGIPAKIVGIAKPEGPDCMPSLSMDHHMPHGLLVDEGSGI